MLTNISTIIGLIGLTFTLALLTWQTRAVAEQTRISNNIAAASVLSDTGIRLREICMVFVDHPELRPYFTVESHALGAARDKDRSSRLRSSLLTRLSQACFHTGLCLQVFIWITGRATLITCWR
jgi:hypothetical protein